MERYFKRIDEALEFIKEDEWAIVVEEGEEFMLYNVTNKRKEIEKMAEEVQRLGCKYWIVKKAEEKRMLPF